MGPQLLTAQYLFTSTNKKNPTIPVCMCVCVLDSYIVMPGVFVWLDHSLNPILSLYIFFKDLWILNYKVRWYKNVNIYTLCLNEFLLA